MKSLRVLAAAKGCDLADGLISGGEGGLLHLRAISEVVGRKIRVWDSSGKVLGVFSSTKDTYGNRCNSLHEICSVVTSSEDKDLKSPSGFLCNKQLSENFVELQYTVLQDGYSGHWVSKSGIDPDTDGNNCLFSAICVQCDELEPENLRKLTADVIRLKQSVIEWGFSQFYGSGVFLLGGARYRGTIADHAKMILDNSQGTRGHGHVAVAHPRGHASHPEATGPQDSVENYSRSSSKSFPKSAWMSRNEQDEAMNILLQSSEAQQAMDDLNRGQTRVVIKLRPTVNIKVGLWAEGKMFSGPHMAHLVTILLQHHQGKQNEHDADVQVFTCYPMVPTESQNIEALPAFSTSLKRNNTDDEKESDEELNIKRIKTEHDL